jgi:hypothetical protein
MRQFDSVVFMGAGAHSGADCYLLHTILDRALSNLSAIQQGADDDILEHEVEDIAKDLCAALTGRKVKFGEELPYPGKIERHHR